MTGPDVDEHFEVERRWLGAATVAVAAEVTGTQQKSRTAHLKTFSHKHKKEGKRPTGLNVSSLDFSNKLL